MRSRYLTVVRSVPFRLSMMVRTVRRRGMFRRSGAAPGKKLDSVDSAYFPCRIFYRPTSNPLISARE